MNGYLISAAVGQTQMYLAAGFILLGWVLARRQLAMRKRVNRDARAANRELTKIRKQKDPAVPLAGAPVETQRWQVAMFDLQRELKAELDTRITVVQTLVRQADERIARLESMSRVAQITGDQHDTFKRLVRNGHTASEISSQTGLPLGDVEMAIATLSPMPNSIQQTSTQQT